MSAAEVECPHGMADPAWCSVCKHGPSRPTRTEFGGPFRARFPGGCAICRAPFDEGDRIATRYHDNQDHGRIQAGYVHEECIP